jgi:serine protease Do
MNEDFNEYEKESFEENSTNTATNAAAEKPKSSSKKTAKKVCALVMSGILFGGVAGGTLYGTNYLLKKNQTQSSESTESGTTGKKGGSSVSGDNQVSLTTTTDDVATNSTALTTTTADSDTLGVEEIAQNCLPSVVAITNVGVSEVQTLWGTYQQESESAGSGVIIGKTDDELIILTNNHVISGSQQLTVVFSYDEDSDDPTAVEARVKGYDAERDVAVIAVDLDDCTDEILSNIKIAVIGDSDDLELGEQIVAIGNALGYGQSVTTGIISALNRYVELEGTDGTTISNYYIQTDAAINPGNSGGAMFTMDGKLVGINSAKVSSSSVEGMGYAIPISDIEDLVNDLMNMETKVELAEEEQGYLCIAGQDVDSTTASMYGIPEGVYVSSVYEGLAADNAGIEEGDIITEINGIEISSMSELKTQLSYIAGGDTVKITIVRLENRSYVEKEINVTLSSYDDFNGISSNSSSSSGSSSSGNSGSNGYSYPGYSDEDIWNYFYGN